jgi:hypothetical protein
MRPFDFETIDAAVIARLGERRPTSTPGALTLVRKVSLHVDDTGNMVYKHPRDAEAHL